MNPNVHDTVRKDARSATSLEAAGLHERRRRPVAGRRAARRGRPGSTPRSRTPLTLQLVRGRGGDDTRSACPASCPGKACDVRHRLDREAARPRRCSSTGVDRAVGPRRPTTAGERAAAGGPPAGRAGRRGPTSANVSSQNAASAKVSGSMARITVTSRRRPAAVHRGPRYTSTTVAGRPAPAAARCRRRSHGHVAPHERARLGLAAWRRASGEGGGVDEHAGRHGRGGHQARARPPGSPGHPPHGEVHGDGHARLAARSGPDADRQQAADAQPRP